MSHNSGGSDIRRGDFEEDSDKVHKYLLSQHSSYNISEKREAGN